MRSERKLNPRRAVAAGVLAAMVAILGGHETRPPATSAPGGPPSATIEAAAFQALPPAVRARIVEAADDAEYAAVAHLVSRACFDRLRPSHRRLLRCVAADRAAGVSFNVAMCFGPGIDGEFAERFSAELYGDGAGVDRFQQTTRWATTATDGSGLGQGDPTTLTYSFVPDGTNVPCVAGACWPDAPSDFQAWMNSLYGSPDVWQALFADVFDRWSELCGITFVYEPHDDGVDMNGAAGVLGVRGDLRIGGKSLDGDNGVLAYNNFPQDGDMVFDTFDSYFANMSNDSRRLRNVIAHEHGHGMGQLHVCPADATKLMEPYITSVFDGPQPDDVLNAQRHYGDAGEHNDLPQTATDLGVLATGATTITDLSIDDNTDVDYFRFTLPGARDVTATMRPVGSTYDEGPQTPECDAGTPFDSLVLKDLQVELRDADGATVLAIGNTQPAGVPESAQYVFANPGTYYAFVRGGTENTIQAYELEVLVEDPPFVPIAVSVVGSAPSELAPGVPVSFDVMITTGDDVLVPDTTNLLYRYDRAAPFAASPLLPLGGGLYQATLPPAACGEAPEFFVSAEGEASGVITNPVGGAEAPFTALVGITSIAFADDFEQDLGWTVSGNASDGAWERGTPIVECDRGSPLLDADGSGQCYLTDNSAANSCNSDVDSGTTSLTSPVFDLSGGGSISFSYWLNDIPSGPIGPEDELTVEIATDAEGALWSTVRTYTTAANQWRDDTVVIGSVGDAPASPTVRVRFSVSDNSPGDVIEAALDAIEVTAIECEGGGFCLADIAGAGGVPDGNVDALDLLALIAQWGSPCGGSCSADVTGPVLGIPDGNVDALDLLRMIAEWGTPANCL